MRNNILIATDGSAAANRALPLAAHLARTNDAALYLLTVVRDIQVPPEMKDMARVENLGETRVSVLEFVANQILESAEQRLKNDGVEKIYRAIANGDPATEIVRYAKKHDIDLIVIGTRGLGQVKGMLMGSVSRKVANVSDTNCLLVR